MKIPLQSHFLQESHWLMKRTKKSSTGKATVAGGDKFHLEGDKDKVAGKTQNLTLSVKYHQTSEHMLFIQ